MEYSKSEDCLIFYAFTPKYTKFRQVSSAVLDFMKNKQATEILQIGLILWFT
jgi:hypothetical protein